MNWNKTPLLRNIAKKLAPLLILLPVGTSVQAASLALYTFNDGTTNVASEDPLVTAGTLTQAGGIGTLATTANGTIRGVGDTGYVLTWAMGSIGSSENSSISGDDFFTFTVTPDEGYEINLSEISFYGWANTSGTLTEDYHYFVRTSATGTTTLGTFASSARVANATVPTTANQYTLDLSGNSALQNIASATTFTIGVYRGASDSSFMRLDSVALAGSVSAIPEPSSTTFLLGAGVLLLVGLYSRMRKR